MGTAVAVLGDERDRYGRTLARIEVEGQDVGHLLVAEGLAWHYVRFSDDATLADAEAEARAARRGLWADDRVGFPAPGAMRVYVSPRGCEGPAIPVRHHALSSG